GLAPSLPPRRVRIRCPEGFAHLRCQTSIGASIVVAMRGLAIVHSLRLLARTMMFSSEAGCKDFLPRESVMPAPSAATAHAATSPSSSGITSLPGLEPRIAPPIENSSPVSALPSQPTLQCVEKGIQLGLLREDAGGDADALVVLPVADPDV